MEQRWNNAVLKSLTDGLEMLRVCELYTDITICVEEVSYRCHKAVLSSLSPYFNIMFSSNMRESQSEKVSLPFLDCETFETLLDFFYSGKDVVTFANVENVLQAASFLQIQCLQDRCVNVLCETLNEANCIRLWQLAKLHNYMDLEYTAWMWLMDRFTKFSTESFSALDVDELVSIVEAEDLKPRSESLVCDVALNWLAADIDLQQKFLVKVLGSLKLSLTSGDYLLSLSTRYPFIEEQEDANNLLMEAFKYHILPVKRDYEQMSSEIEHTIVVIGNVDELNNDAGDVRCFSMTDHRWYKLPPVPYRIVCDAALCTYGSQKLCVSGGGRNPQKTAMYNADTNAWNMRGTLNDGRRDHIMIAVSDSLYVLGGSDPDLSIERCIIEEGKYVRVGELQGIHAYLSAEVVGDDIILFGGEIEDYCNDASSEVQCFNTVTCTLTVICDAPSIRMLTKSIKCDESILTITMDGSILKLIQAQDGTYECPKIARVKSRGHVAMHEFCVVSEKDGKMIILGNKENYPVEDLIIVECDTGDVLWTIKMPFTVRVCGMARLAIQRQHLSDSL
jgi:hypothetical protein